MSIWRRAYTVLGVVLMLQFFAQLYLIAAAFFTVTGAKDSAADVYSGFKQADRFAGLHVINGYVIGLTILLLLVLSFASRFPWRTTILTGVLFILLLLQSILANLGIPAVSGLHGVNALILVGLGGYLTGRHWAFRRAAPAPAQPA